MGYTHYWQQKKDVSPLKWRLFTDQVKLLLKAVNVPVVYEYDQPNQPPVINDDQVRFNGVGDDGHETFLLTRKRRAKFDYETAADLKGGLFNFCKTANKPYDLLVCAVLIVAEGMLPNVWRVSSDGGPEDWTDAIALVQRVLESQRYRLPAEVADA